MKTVWDAGRPAQGQELIAPVTILDAQGRVVRVVDAAEFRRTHLLVAASRSPVPGVRRHRHGQGTTS